MNEDFVTYEIAVKLKEKGFRKPCIAHYCCLDGNVLKFNITTDCIRGSNIKCLNGENNIYTDAPTLPQVLKCLREEKKLHLVIDFDGGMGWYYQIALYGLTTYEKESEHKYNSYEKAALAGVAYCLENLI